MKNIALMDRFGKDFTEGENFIYYAKGFLERGCAVVQIDPYTINFEKANAKSYELKNKNGFERNYKEKEINLTDFDAIIDLSDIVDYEFAKQLDKIDVLHINPPIATFNSADKTTYPEKYPEYIPKTVIGSDAEELLQALRKIVTPGKFGSLIVLKNPYSSLGKDVDRVDIKNPKSKDFIHKFTKYGKQKIVAQKYLEFASEGSKRVGVIGDINKPESYQIVHFYKRIPGKGNWKDNLSQGGRVKDIHELRDEEIALCLNVAKASGLYTVGLDIMNDLDNNGNKITRLIETNAVLAFSANGRYNNKLKKVTNYILDKLIVK